MALALGTLFGGAAVACGYAAFRGNKTLRQLDQDKSEMLNNVATEASFPAVRTTKPVLFQHDIKSDVGMVDVFEQGIETEETIIPFASLGTGLNFDALTGRVTPALTLNGGSVRHEENKIKFKFRQSFLTDPTFGSRHLINSGRFNPSKFKGESITQPTKHEMLQGSDMRARFNTDYKISLPLASDDVYKYSYYPFNNRTLYFSGNKVGDKLVYNHMGIEPLGLVAKEYEDRESSANFAKYGGIGGAILFGLAGIAVGASARS
jgi:hypothetical protein